MENNETKKFKFLFGLVYFKIDKYYSEWEFRLFGIKLLKSRVKNILRSRETVYFLGIPIFCHSIKNRLTKNYMDTIIRKYPNYDNYIVFSSGCGEIFWAFAHLFEFIQNNKITNPLIICEREILQDIYFLFDNLKYPVVVEKNVSGLLLNYKNNYLGKKFFVPLNYRYFGQNEKNIIKNNVHYYDELKKQLNVKNKPIIEVKKVQNYIKDKISCLATGILNNKFVIIMPEARTIKELERDFWENIVLEFKNNGYEVFYNCSFIGDSIKGAVTMFLSFHEFIELAKYSSAIIGLRNGFQEVLSVLSQKPTIAIYNKFNQYAQNKLTAQEALNGFAIKNLPNISSNKILEYKYKDCTGSQNFINFINEIMLKIEESNDSNICLEYYKNIFDWNIENNEFMPLYQHMYHTASILKNCSMRDVFVKRIAEDFLRDKITEIKNQNNKQIYLFTDLDINVDFCVKSNLDTIKTICSQDAETYIIVLAYNMDFIAKNIIKELNKYNLKYLSLEQYGTPQARYFHTNQNCYETLMDECTNAPLTHICPQDFENIFQAIEATKHIDGDIVEIGTFQGASARATLNYLKRINLDKKCYFFDTYEGFTYDEAQNSQDQIWSNTHTDTSIEQVQSYLSHYDNFDLIKSNIIKDSIPDKIKKICVANIDVDMYEAVKGALYKVKDLIVTNGIIICEDYGHTPALIGAQKAVDEFLEENPDDFIPIYMASGQMFLIKK